MKRGLILLLGAYAAGAYVAYRYRPGAKAGKVVKNASFVDDISAFGQAFIAMHRDMLENLEDTYLSTEDAARIRSYRTKLADAVRAFETDARTTLTEAANGGSERLEKTWSEVKSRYEQARATLTEATDSSKTLIGAAAERAQHVWTEAEHALEATYRDAEREYRRLADTKKKSA